MTAALAPAVASMEIRPHVDTICYLQIIDMTGSMKGKGEIMVASGISLNPGRIALAVVISCIILWITGIPQYFFKPKTSSLDDRNISLRELLSAGIDVARNGGKIVVAIRDGKATDMHASSKGKTLEGADEMKTEGDMQSHVAMMYGLSQGFKNLPIVSEEHDAKPVDLSKVSLPNKMLSDVTHLPDDEQVALSDITVWIDPLDATQEYTENLRQYVTTMMCVAVKGKPVIGVIHVAFNDQTYWGYVGKGYSSNLKPAEEKEKPEGEPHSIIVSRSHTGNVESVVKAALGDDTKVILAGGAGYKTLQVITGEADAYVHTTRIKKWDICAGDAILRAVGGRMTTLEGGDIDYRSDGDPRNDKGLLATLRDHIKFLKIFGPEYERVRRGESEAH